MTSPKIFFYIYLKIFPFSPCFELNILGNSKEINQNQAFKLDLRL